MPEPTPDPTETLAAWRAAEAALSRATHGDDPTTWAGTPWWHVHQLLRVLTAADQGVTRPGSIPEAWWTYRDLTKLSRDLVDEREGSNGRRNAAAIVYAVAQSLRPAPSTTTHPSGQEPTTRGAGA